MTSESGSPNKEATSQALEESGNETRVEMKRQDDAFELNKDLDFR